MTSFTFVPLLETGIKTNKFEMLAKGIQAASTSAALAEAAEAAPEGRRVGVFPYQTLTGWPQSQPVDVGETGKKYSALAQIDGVNAYFTPFNQTPVSIQIDAAQIAMSLGRLYGFRIGLIAFVEDPPETPPEAVRSESVKSSAKGK
ncbi:hypothetical protein CGLAMM_07275 [Acetobacteraceae bacterium EV16G]|uniref:Uncharacterized protein n=1 Tax=Sorlinia euscelidii TaxID=3081148 RepID=A0ABU7U451_9PROT